MKSFCKRISWKKAKPLVLQEEQNKPRLRKILKRECRTGTEFMVPFEPYKKGRICEAEEIKAKALKKEGVRIDSRNHKISIQKEGKRAELTKMIYQASGFLSFKDWSLEQCGKRKRKGKSEMEHLELCRKGDHRIFKPSSAFYCYHELNKFCNFHVHGSEMMTCA